MPHQLYGILKAHPFTAGLKDAHVHKLSALATDVVFQEGQVIVHAGEPAPNLYLLTSGSACVEIRTDAYGVCIQPVDPGGAFGWSSVVDHLDAVFQVRARERSTAVRLDSQKLVDLCLQDPAFGYELFQRMVELVARRLQACELRLAEFCGIPRPQKLNCSTVRLKDRDQPTAMP